MIITTIESVPGKEIKEVYGLVTASTVRSKNIGKDIGAGLKSLAGGETSSYHDALDIECPDFTPVKAVKSGKIIECWPSYYNGGAKYKGHPTYGGYIEIQHEDGTRSGYAHLSLTSVKEGDTVKQGEIIGRSGGVSGRRGSGLSTGPHLHFFIRFNMNSFYSIK